MEILNAQPCITSIIRGRSADRGSSREQTDRSFRRPEYALWDNARPLGIAEYQAARSLPEPLQATLPTIEQIEREPAGDQSPD